MRRRWPELLLAIGLAWTKSSAAQTLTFSVKKEEVRIDVLVTEHGSPVHGLGVDDFEVLDNGVRQRVNFASEVHTPFNAVLVLDMSESVAGERLLHLKEAGGEFLNALKTDERAALVTFSHAVSLDSGLTNDTYRVNAKLDAVQPSGTTSVIDASYIGLMIAESNPGRPLVIVFSDGLDTSSWLTGDAVHETAKISDAVVYAVSVGRYPKITFLRDLTQLTGGALFEIESRANLGAMFLNILEEFRRRYLVTYSPDGVLRGGWHQLEVHIKGRKLEVRARPGYAVGPGSGRSDPTRDPQSPEIP